MTQSAILLRTSYLQEAKPDNTDLTKSKTKAFSDFLGHFACLSQEPPSRLSVLGHQNRALILGGTWTKGRNCSKMEANYRICRTGVGDLVFSYLR